MNRPLIGLTMGDVAGVGPEIAIKTLQDRSFLNACRMVVLGDRSAWLEAGERLDAKIELKEVSSREELLEADDELLFYPLTEDVGRRVQTGSVSRDAERRRGCILKPRPHWPWKA